MKDLQISENAIPTEDAEKNSAVKLLKKGRGGAHNMQKNFGEENVQPGDNARYLRYAMASLNLPPIDISDPKQVEQRIYAYFTFCIDNDRKPNMIGMANWLGVDSDTVRTWKNGEYRKSTHTALIKKAIAILEEQWVDYMQNGKINPASGIFLAKNMFQYRDVIDLAPATSTPLGEMPDRKQIQDKYSDLPED